MNERILADTGAIVALIDPRDQHHSWAKATFRNLPACLLTCDAVISESHHLLGKVPNGRDTLRDFLRLKVLESAFDLSSQLSSLLALLAKYEDTPMDFADACLVRMSENLPDSTVWTVDSDFRIYRRSNRRIIPVLAPWK